MRASLAGNQSDSSADATNAAHGRDLVLFAHPCSGLRDALYSSRPSPPPHTQDPLTPAAGPMVALYRLRDHGMSPQQGALTRLHHGKQAGAKGITIMHGGSGPRPLCASLVLQW